MGVEPTSPAWEAEVITVIRRPLQGLCTDELTVHSANELWFQSRRQAFSLNVLLALQVSELDIRSKRANHC